MDNLKTDWEALKAMTEEEIERNAMEDPDAPLTTPEMWKDARIVMPSGLPKRTISIRVSDKVLEYFKASGKGYQSRMNAVLESYVNMDISKSQHSI
jgi:uncharacterized protein (DUF4415 family)